ncbi:cysteine peptidase family C39 domain-containing protein [Ochrobactrum sp. GPK 3]
MTIKGYWIAPVIWLVVVMPAAGDDFISAHKTFMQKNWKQGRDRRVSKQLFDTSCGAASVVNILKEYFHFGTNEMKVMQAMHVGKSTYSMLDLSKAVRALGFETTVFAAPYDTLKLIKSPVIIHFNDTRDGHFVVLRSISDNYILVSDPAWGLRRFTRQQFIARWSSADDMVRAMAITGRTRKQDNTYFGGSMPEDQRFYHDKINPDWR